MVLILSLFACLKNPTVRSDSFSKEISTVAVLEGENTLQQLPTELQDNLRSRLQDSGISVRFIPHSDNFQTIKDGQGRLATYSENEVLLIESSAIYFAQVGGRFRWETNFDIYLKSNGNIVEKHLKIPVFLIYHHQREADALLEAESVLSREIGQFLSENLGGK